MSNDTYEQESRTMTTYQCRDCGYAYGHMTPSPLAIAGHRQSEHGEYHGLGAPITAQED